MPGDPTWAAAALKADWAWAARPGHSPWEATARRAAPLPAVRATNMHKHRRPAQLCLVRRSSLRGLPCASSPARLRAGSASLLPARWAAHLRKVQRLCQLALPYELDQPLLLQVEEQPLLRLQNLRVQVVHALNGLRAAVTQPVRMCRAAGM